MCGIVGYVGSREATEVLVAGLERLEYRGYDSVGLAVQNGRGIGTRKVVGRVEALKSLVARSPVDGSAGIGHTRWATHGAPCNRNAHPHQGCNGWLALVHNGIIENADTLREMLARSGHKYHTETDSEVLVHLIEEMPGQCLERQVSEALRLVQGTYGIAVMSEREPGKIVAARRGSPLLLGIGDGEFFVASDGAAVRDHTQTFVYLEDGDLAVVTRDGYVIRDSAWQERVRAETHIDWSVEAIQLGSYDHFMLKEIHEQPESVRSTLRGRLGTWQSLVRLHGLHMTPEQLARVESVTILACGTSWHAGLIGRYLIEGIAGVPVRVEYASEYRYGRIREHPNALVVAISQSGETVDTLEAMRAAKSGGSRVLGIVNVVGSTIAREARGGIYLHAGPEVGIGSTKAFTSQVAALSLLALKLGLHHGASEKKIAHLTEELYRIPELLERALELEPQVREIAEAHASARNALFLGRGVNFPVALEGALKLKEISQIHAEGLPAAEMKHGPIALIDENMPVFFVAPRDPVYDRKVLSNIQEVRARGGRIIVVNSEGSNDLSGLVDHELPIPDTLPQFSPLLSVIPLQLLAYHTAVLRGCDVDRPRQTRRAATAG
jgi:glucosamine--fructose-6-phosphate aminotransferase (isomerizing)